MFILSFDEMLQVKPRCPACHSGLIKIDSQGLEQCFMCAFQISYFINGVKK